MVEVGECLLREGGRGWIKEDYYIMVVLCSSLFLVFFLFGFLRMSVIYGRNSCCEVGILRFVGVLDFVCFIGCVSVECCRDVLMLWFCV